MKLFKPDEVAEILGVTVGTVKTWAKNKQLIGIQLGASGRWRFEQAEIENYINKQKETSYNKSLPHDTINIPPAVKLVDAVQELENDLFKRTADHEPEPSTQQPTEITAIEIILKLKSEKVTYAKIADELNSMGIKTARNKDWTADAVEGQARKYKKPISAKTE